MIGYYVSHPEVVVDPLTPVPKWGLSEKGRARAVAFGQAGVLNSVSRLICSDEVKAQETAEILASAAGVSILVDPLSCENDRSATGFLPPDQFQRVADQFFAQPAQSIHGWERAVDAQSRILACFDRACADGGAFAMIGHGGVGTLLYCALAHEPIARRWDQTAVAPDGGAYFAIDLAERRPLTSWRAFEQAP